MTTLADGSEVSTVFLGVDMDIFGGKPLLFETMVFAAEGSDMDPEASRWTGIDCERYHTWDEAVQGHHEIVESLTATFLSPTLLHAVSPKAENE